MTDKTQRSGARLLTWLGIAAIKTREGANFRREDVASYTGAGIDQISRLERAEQHPRDLERIFAGYAHFAGIDPRDIYELALELWREHGTAPTVDDAVGARLDSGARRAGQALRSDAPRPKSKAPKPASRRTRRASS